ncbi:MAG: hypothetical protein FWB78_05970 [Treponema sp.]|nr:hypothetical protein [Treponema sp.]
MMRRILLNFLLLALLAAWHPLAAAAQQRDFGVHPEIIRGEVWVDLEPIHGDRPDEEFPLSPQTASRRALQEAALYFSAMIYGWSFRYEIGERARGIPEDFGQLEPMGEIRWGDPRLAVTDVQVHDTRVRIWADYHMSGSQQRRIQTWRMGTVRNAHATGFSPLYGPYLDSTWLDIRYAALTDAARIAVREMLRANERNRPREASGFISLATFPRFYVRSGQLVASARFRVQITEVVPFAVH